MLDIDRGIGRLGLLAALIAAPLAATPVLAETRPTQETTATADARVEADSEKSRAERKSEPTGSEAASAATLTAPATPLQPPSEQARSEQAAPAIAPPETKPEPAKSTDAQPVEAAPATAAAAAAPALTLDVAAALERVQGRAAADRRDRTALLEVYAERQGKPIWVGPKGPLAEAEKLAAGIAKAGDWGLNAGHFDVPRLDSGTGDAELAADRLAEVEVRLSLAALKYARHARGGRFEPTQLTKFLDRKSPVYEPRTVLTQIAAAAEPGEYLKSLHPRHAEFERLRQRYIAVRGNSERAKGSSATEAERLLANMEQWRWMPDDLGAFHIIVNIPEYQFRVVRDGKVIHSERVVVGKLNAQTPIFSDVMEQVIFHPFWGVPDSIKRNEVLPSLRGSGGVLAKYNLRIQQGGRDIDPRSVDWSQTDIRRFHVYQPPGRDNVLGVVKFIFPNKHDVYMHDTPSKGLFRSTQRTYSAGCMRVQDPLRLAELILAEDRQMPAERVRALARPDAPQNNAQKLTRQVPVHMVYFTKTVDVAGKVTSLADVYGHEERIRLALAGKMHLVKPVPEPTGPADGAIERLVESRPTDREWVRRVFSGGSDAFSGGN